jgi:DNA-directed RNA polymerase I subunit RPA2
MTVRGRSGSALLPHERTDQRRCRTSRPGKYFLGVLNKVNFDVGHKLAYFLATGNLVSPTGLDLQQTTGYTIVAEKLNFYRYLSHFRCIHRGAFFAELKTTTVRKLLPESWGQCLDGMEKQQWPHD